MDNTFDDRILWVVLIVMIVLAFALAGGSGTVFRPVDPSECMGGDYLRC